MEIKIRDFRREDWPQVSKILHKEENYKHIDSFLNDQSVIAYVACIDTEIVGFIYGYLLKRIESKSMLYIHSVDVLPTYRKRGIGTMMIYKMIDIANKKECKKLFVITDQSNQIAQKLYKNTGGTPLESVVFNFI